MLFDTERFGKHFETLFFCLDKTVLSKRRFEKITRRFS